MNLYSAVQTAYGSRVRRAGILRRRRSLNSAQGLYEFFTAYADETTKETYVAPCEINAANEEDYLRAVLAGQAPLRPEIDYVPFRSRVTAFGRAARPEIYRTHRFEDLPDAERMKRLRRWWLKNTADETAKAHHIVFTLDPRLAAAMAQAGASADAFLLTAVSNAFTEFQSRFYPGDVLGYLVALHHDRAHIHAHVLVHPRTEQGARVNLSILRRYKVGDRVVNVPCQQILKDAFERQAEAACARFLPQPPAPLAQASERRAEIAEELMLVARVKREPTVKPETGIESLVSASDEILGRPDCLSLLRQGRDATAHLIAENLADGRRYELRHNFAAIADKSAQAQFATTAQARATLGMLTAVVERPATLFIGEAKLPLLAITCSPRAGEGASFIDEIRARDRHFAELSRTNERLRYETAILRATILSDDKAETECAIATAHTVLRLFEAVTPTLGEAPDLLTLWTPPEEHRPRLRSRRDTAAQLDHALTHTAAALAARHQPVNLAEHMPTLTASTESDAMTDDEPHHVRIVVAPPGFLAQPHAVRVDELLTLTPVADRAPNAPAPEPS